jgi:hypothetical protein
MGIPLIVDTIIVVRALLDVEGETTLGHDGTPHQLRSPIV